ncbi:acetyl-CoA acetyltransferase [Bordetella sp. BOR01]|nr:acetyl-CoA acetyltransferase [Bordetella sp. BOR01]
MNESLNTPILVGCGDVTDMTTLAEQGRSPYDLIAQAARLALADTGAAATAQVIDSVTMLRCFADTSHRFATKLGASTNPPKSVSDRLGLRPAQTLYTWNGGNMPQYMVNQYAERISRGDLRAALIFGGEALRTQYGVEKRALPVSWAEDPGGTPELVGDPRRGWSDTEDRHDMRAAISIYPLFENAIRGARGRTVAQHLQAMAGLMARFSRVAADNPLATRRDGYSAQRLATVDAENRWIGFPYPRLMNSNAFIDQAAALVITSVGQAQALGIPREKWIYLHGCADAHDHWYVSERINLHSSPAIRAASRQALQMAGLDLAQVDFLDLYSCFSSAVEIACQEIGLAEDDPRGLTVTGGLPYFGGPGNSYVVHSISAMMRRLRARPGAFGLVTANGNYVTKHAFGVYSTTPTRGAWRREDPGTLQHELDRLPTAPFTECPAGAATVESYTVMHDRDGPRYGLVVGRELATGQRFIANTPADQATLLRLRDEDSLGLRGRVSHRDGRNTFVPEFGRP